MFREGLLRFYRLYRFLFEYYLVVKCFVGKCIQKILHYVIINIIFFFIGKNIIGRKRKTYKVNNIKYLYFKKNLVLILRIAL